MNKRCRSVALGDADEGMLLAEDLRDAQGAVLLPAGTALSAGVLRSLGRRGITSLMVVDERAEPADFEAARARAEARLAHLFRKCSGRACGELRRQVGDFRMDELA